MVNQAASACGVAEASSPKATGTSWSRVAGALSSGTVEASPAGVTGAASTGIYAASSPAIPDLSTFWGHRSIGIF